MGNWNWKEKVRMRGDGWNPRFAHSCWEITEGARVPRWAVQSCRHHFPDNGSDSQETASVRTRSRCSALSPPSPPSVAGRLQPLRISILIVSRMLRKWNCAECSFGLLRPASFSGKWARWLHFHFCRVCSTVWMYHSLLSYAPVARPLGCFQLLPLTS